MEKFIILLLFSIGITKSGPLGPYIQSERLPIYQQYVNTLVKVELD